MQRKAPRKNIPSHKYNIKNEKDDYTNNRGNFWDEIVNRNRLFYCTHMNRKNAFFQKHILNGKHPPKQIAHTIVTGVLGFSRVRKPVKEALIDMFTKVVVNQKKFDFNYYLSKNCPMPDDWKNRKKYLLAEAAKGGASRGEVFKELYSGESSYR